MATSSRTLSPGGALLRASRMFSLPAPIPPPPSNNPASPHHSETATTAYPTHQVITTLPSARKQGDWGLKRPLPLKSTTRTTHPLLRIKAIDTVEQITDFSSGADHAITLRKFQELGLPVTSQRTAAGDSAASSVNKMYLPQKSAFEDELDVTDVPPEKRTENLEMRWKFSGPWLAGMPPGEFQRWLAREVRPKRAAFREFLRGKIASELNEAAATAALDKAEPAPAPIDASSVTEDQVVDFLRRMRYDKQPIYDLVGEFLDLAPLKPPTLVQTGLPEQTPIKLEYKDVNSPYAEHGPPVTHPSAGLSYLRTSMYMENHPLYGPQKEHAPVVARVLRPRQNRLGTRAKLGVAGFVVDSGHCGDAKANQKAESSMSILNPDVVGGHKLWVQPRQAYVDSTGHVMLTVSDASQESVLVAQELVGDAVVLGTSKRSQPQQRAETALDLRNRYKARPTSSAPALSSAQDYGLKP
ncbi:hypothetical protein VTJ83DRAFT_4293 [Remersonia thermophila]|uniref:Uncharacterized protein n=1 Tax=Remersonia thermophila TaxID=72144 RepID=A0ABR4D9K3_9PEZI